ncbi:protoheme IX farnesyltransferase [Methylocella silvestris BL2]|uniref:Protoheme IX farnesyltransferase n=1 Tax=Methylocella silvestris (strain DSM 15510 / CIP 108128 / LMG 27833 / NCIMB 13906 / BL2) TaxID=395965 RepID=COXX_METSB|nr:heme o synthase [Methylocella silvestris]B8EPK3.1 RecName: Full=Protoheme IX farnesyltransferase; AltName: Full=Heme B farnesyltransferase; AltName: Full=Heme O synthase [Methylocella silvestris BL2]ACK50208.1 protoheme IX farnesyltransferase [Methylocella silvestris BL2]
MSFVSDSNTAIDQAAISIASPADYLALMKPRVMSLVIFTALTGVLIAPTHVNPIIGFASLLAIAAGAGASGALNMWYDSDIDAIMRRTQKRPIPAGRVARESALAFGMVLALLSVITLGFVANWAAAALLAFTIFFYVVIYTMWLKRSTPQNIVIGGAAGAFPPIVAYLAVAGQVSLPALALFAIIFVWTPPHFWALALVKAGDFERAGIPMLPNVKGPDRTRRDILLYTLLLAPIGMTPYFIGFASPAYGLLSFGLGGVMILHAVRVYLAREGDQANRVAMRMFGFSILYLFLLFAAIVAERILALLPISSATPW